MNQHRVYNLEIIALSFNHRFLPDEDVINSSLEKNEFRCNVINFQILTLTRHLVISNISL